MEPSSGAGGSATGSSGAGGEGLLLSLSQATSAPKAKRKTNIRLNRAYDFETIEEERANMIRQIQRTIEYLDFLPITMLSIDNVEARIIIET